MQTTFQYGEGHLTVQIALNICNGTTTGILTDSVKEKVEQSRRIVEKIAVGDDAVYGINTGFGPLCTTRISAADTVTLQYNILKSHSVGVGEPTPPSIAKLMMILKVHSLAKGFSGVSLTTLERIIWHIDHNIIPVVPQQGSVGASGDLAPLAHLFLPLIGLGKLWQNGTLVATPDYFAAHNLLGISLGAKEGLALINGTQFIAAYAVQVVARMQNCLSQADLIGTMMIEGLLGSNMPFHPAVHQLRPYQGSQHVAMRVAALLANSEVVQSHAHCDRVQDPYSLRCMPQVHGASRTAWLHLKELVTIEINSVTDNPLIINENLSISAGNFHGQPLAMPLDYACLAASEIGNISDRRIYLSLTGVAHNVPKLLMTNTGINSAFMMPQYTSAALASENKTYCFPASADSIPTSLGQEDHVSMGSISGRKAFAVIGNVEKILAIELMAAAQAMDFHSPLKPGRAIHEMYNYTRSKITHAEEDRIFADDIEKAIEIVLSKKLVDICNSFEELKTPFHQQFETLQ